ncbi:MAG TPA: hypothetical protein VFV03_02540 [Solirubrobacteraceae bacterium]|nr:hypothetical protein [Solirubrobacteraceae bacterium]
MRRHSCYGWQWMRWYASDGSARYTAPRRPEWDVRCDEPACERTNGRKSARWAPRRRRRRAGERYR